MEYNDIIVGDTKFGKILAKYMVYRPDKDLVLVDFNNRFHQLDPKKIRLANEEDIKNIYIPVIETCDKTIENNKTKIQAFKKQIEEYDVTFENITHKLKKKYDEHESLLVIKEMLTTQNTPNVGDILNKIHIVDGEISCLLNLLKGVSSEIERRKDANGAWKSDIEIAKIKKKEAENEMKKLLEVLNENRKGSKTISKASV